MGRKIKLTCLILAMMIMLAPISIMQADSTKADSNNQVSSAVPSAPGDIKTRLNNAVVLYIGSTQALVNNSEIQIDTASTDVKPVIKNDRTLVPVRFISESLGAEVNWNVKSSTVKVSLGGKAVELVIGNANMKVGGKSITLDAPAEIIGNRTFIPLRKLVEALGKKVFYDRGLIIINDNENVFNKTTEKGMIDSVIAKVNNLPVVGTFEKLKNLMAESSPRRSYYDNGLSVARTTGVTMEKAVDAAPAAMDQASTNSAVENNTGVGMDYSKTNVQVQGVDEADVVKTDGQYIYQVNKNRIIVAKAYPADSMKIESTVTFPDNNFTPAEIYVDSKYLIVIGSFYSNNQIYSRETTVPENKCYDLACNTVKAIVYDINDKSNISKIREFEIDGTYVSSRKIGSSLYMISNRYASYVVNENDPQITPCYRDTAVKDDYIEIGCPEIRYFPQMVEPSYMVIGGIDLNNMNEAAKVNTYLGAGQNVYASEQNLYVTVGNYKYTNTRTTPMIDVTSDITVSSKSVTTNASTVESDVSSTMPANKPSIIPVTVSNSTSVYKFSLNNSQVTYINKGEVPGLILNQFSMDEYNSYFRIATTTGEVWQDNSKNNVYVMDELLNIVGKIEDIAQGEKIYSTRFMGDRGYMVTFKKVDPLFVIDLKDPRNPAILGSLKIPGYSDYLHPYDENHIIGFGKDTEEIGNGAYYQGMKIAIFDVTDVSKPVEMFKENIGDRGTDSELLRNHKALLFSKEKNLLAFPVTVMEVKDKDSTNKDSVFQYGQFAFQGAYVYNIDLNNGFTLKGKITHMSDEDYLKSGSYGYDNDKYVQRILYIGDTLYTLSNGLIKANNLPDLKDRNTLLIP